MFKEVMLSIHLLLIFCPGILFPRGKGSFVRGDLFTLVIFRPGSLVVFCVLALLSDFCGFLRVGVLSRGSFVDLLGGGSFVLGIL